MKKLSVIVFAVLALPACSNYSSNGENVYLQSRNGVKLEVPPPLTSANISHFYDLPVQDKPAKVSIAPPIEDITT